MKKFYVTLIALGFLVIDQLLKIWLVTQGRFILNHHFIFGLVNLSFFIIIILILLISFLLALKMKKQIKENALALTLMASGALSNIIDRASYGAVVDYLRIQVGHFSLSFNLADIIIILGIILYAKEIIKKDRN